MTERPATYQQQPTSVPDVMAADPMFAHDAIGQPITRQRTCECGGRFTQRQLSARFMLIVEKQGAGALAAMKRDIPEYFVPVHCPPCERRDLGFSARLAAYNLPEAAD